MSIKLPQEVLATFRMARVAPCAICTTDVAHESLANACTFGECSHMILVCVRCAGAVTTGVLDAVAFAHRAACKGTKPR